MDTVSRKRNKEWIMAMIVLFFVALLCLSLWYLRNVYRVKDMTRVEMENGVFDLMDIDFDRELVRLEGKVEYIPGILSPEEFRARAGEAQTGNPWYESSATSRILLKVPESVYTLTSSSIDFAQRVFVNGELRHQVGIPTERKEDFVPGYAQMTIDVTPQEGVIEIIQQGANFVHREGGGHSNLYFGSPSVIHRLLALTFGPEIITVGLFAALFLMHLVLFMIRRSYRPNLIFALLCLTWMVRTGVTNAKAFYAFFPGLPWQVAIRAEYLSLPIACMLLVLMAGQIFPEIPQKWFVRTMVTVSAGFSVLCLISNTLVMSKALVFFEIFFTLGILYLCVRFAMKVPGMIRSRQFRTEQAVSLVGYIFFMAAGINDALHHMGIPYHLGLSSSFAMTGLAMMIFSFFQMTAMFYGTMREAALAHERERRAEAENEMLSEMNRLKSAFYTDMSHEMKTPLTVIAVNAQFAAQNIGVGAIDEETVTDLNAISAEAKRLAQMVTSLVGIGRMQGEGGSRLSLDSLLNETVRIYQALFARKNNTLTVETEPDMPPVEGNADQLIQVLINLLSNANRHTSGGAVSVRAESLDREVRVSVEDNGEGIPPHLLPHVFERFCHGEKGGSGLGLPICKTIVEEHGGEIYIESEEGKGTRVWFTLPLKEETENEGYRERPAVGGGR